MTTLSDDALQTIQREIQRLLGRCLLRLQQYERLIKAIVAHHEISGPPHALEAIRAARVTETARKTLGTLIGDLLGSYVVVNGDQTAPKDTINSSEDTASFNFRMQLGLSDIDFARTETELRELVLLRNSLVHHFIEEHESFEAAFDTMRTLDQGPIVIEVRHKSWASEHAIALLQRYSIDRVLADPALVWPASDFRQWPRYIRLHGKPKVYYSRYSDAEIGAFSKLLGPDSWCVFDNTASGAAIENALTMLGRR